MLCCFGMTNGYPQYNASAGFSLNTDGHKDSTISNNTINSSLGVCSIEEQMGNGGQLASSPFFKKRIELSRALTYV